MRGFGLASLCGTGRAVASPSLKDHDQRGAFLHHLSQAEESLRGFKNKAALGLEALSLEGLSLEALSVGCACAQLHVYHT